MVVPEPPSGVHGGRHGSAGVNDRPTAHLWRIVVIALGGLLSGVAVACLTALILTSNVSQVAVLALRTDIELEEMADDLRVAVLDVRHYHRNLVFTGPTRIGLADFELAMTRLHGQIDEFASVRIDSDTVAQPDDLRALANAYAAAYVPAIDLYATDRAAFEAASDEGLTYLAALQDEAEKLDTLGEQTAEQALLSVEHATSTATVIMLAVLLGVGVAGLALAVVAFRVMRELRDLEAAQREATTALAAALRSKTDFIADASHELRTPLTVLRGNAEVALAAGPGGRDYEEALRAIVSETERMTRLVGDLLFLARYDAGSVPLELRMVELEPWLAEVAARGEILARSRGGSLVPQLDASGQATLDADRVEQVVMIIIDNAAAFSPPDAPVRLASRVAKGHLLVEVRDQGPGISAEALPRLFDRFYRGDRTRRRRDGGAGLGLAIARTIMDAHAGRIEVESLPGRGTTMRLLLPLAGPGEQTPASVAGVGLRRGSATVEP